MRRFFSCGLLVCTLVGATGCATAPATARWQKYQSFVEEYNAAVRSHQEFVALVTQGEQTLLGTLTPHQAERLRAAHLYKDRQSFQAFADALDDGQRRQLEWLVESQGLLQKGERHLEQWRVSLREYANTLHTNDQATSAPQDALWMQFGAGLQQLGRDLSPRPAVNCVYGVGSMTCR